MEVKTMGLNDNPNRVLQRRRTVTYFTYQEKGEVTVFYHPNPDGKPTLIDTIQSEKEHGAGWYFSGVWNETKEKRIRGPFHTEDQARISAMGWASARQQIERQTPIWEDRQRKRRL